MWEAFKNMCIALFNALRSLLVAIGFIADSVTDLANATSNHSSMFLEDSYVELYKSLYGKPENAKFLNDNERKMVDVYLENKRKNRLK